MFYTVVLFLALAFACAVAGPVALFFHVDAFPIFALGGASYVFALTIGAGGLSEPAGERERCDPFFARSDRLIIRAVYALSFTLAALRAWSDQFPALNPVYANVSSVVLAVGIAVFCGGLLVRTIRRGAAARSR